MRGPEIGALDGKRVGHASLGQLQVGFHGEITRDNLDGFHGIFQHNRRNLGALVQHMRHDRRGAHL